jgi:tetratricopeptide (TPR) repeat protein
MVHHRLGHAVEARQWLEKATQEWRTLSPLAASIAASNLMPFSPWYQEQWFWQDWPVYELYLAEATTLILGHRTEADCLNHLHRAYVYTKLGDSEKADEELQAAVAGRSKVPSAWLARGRVYRLFGDKERARADFAKAHELAPDDPQVQKEYEALGGKEKSDR